MTEEAILAELRTIRDILIITGGEPVEELTNDLSEKHVRFLEELKTGEWVESSDILPKLADEFSVTTEAIRQKKVDLQDRDMVEQSGSGSNTKYRKTGIGLAAERAVEL